MQKYINLQIDAVDHAYLKAEATMHNMNLKDFVALLIKQDLEKKGYNLDRKPQLMAVK